MAITDPYTAFCFDEAVSEFGAVISSELSDIEGRDAKSTKARQELALKSMLGDAKEQFAAPVATTTNPATLKEFEDWD